MELFGYNRDICAGREIEDWFGTRYHLELVIQLLDSVPDSVFYLVLSTRLWGDRTCRLEDLRSETPTGHTVEGPVDERSVCRLVGLLDDLGKAPPLIGEE